MNYDEITKITTERINDYMTEAINTDSKGVAEMFHNAAWGVRSLWLELVTAIDIDMHKKNRYADYELSRKIEKQRNVFIQMTDRERVPLLKSPNSGDFSILIVMSVVRITSDAPGFVDRLLHVR